MVSIAEVTTTDTCARCGLKRLTKTLEEKGTAIRLCDDCFWGQEPGELAENEPAAAEGPTAMSRIVWGPLDDLSTLRESVDVLLEVPYACRWRGWGTGNKAAGGGSLRNGA